MTDNDVFSRANVYIETDPEGIEHVVYRASSLGYCKGALARARLGMTAALPPDWMAEKFQEGHDWEREVLGAGLGVDWLEVTGSELERLGRVVTGDNSERQVEKDLWLNKAGTRVVRVHPDAIVRRGADRAKGELAPLHVCEVKFLAPDSALEMTKQDGVDGLTEAYKWQLSIQMLAFGMPALYVIGAKERDTDGKVTGIAWASTFEVTDPPYSLADVKMRVAEIEGAAARGEMPECPVPFDYPCGFWAEHAARDKVEIEDEMLVHLVESYARNAARLGAVQTEKEAIRADIDGRLAELGLEHGGLCGGWNISVTENRPGNVSWAKWAKDVQKKYPETKDVDVEGYRGAEVLGGIRMEKA